MNRIYYDRKVLKGMRNHQHYPEIGAKQERKDRERCYTEDTFCNDGRLMGNPRTSPIVCTLPASHRYKTGPVIDEVSELKTRR